MQPVTRLFRGGIPTEPSVKMLMEAFKPIEPGAAFSYAKISAVIRENPRTNRFYTVVTQWRKLVRKELNLESVCEAGANSVRILLENERAANARHLARRSIKGLVKARVKAQVIRLEKLTDAERPPAEHTQRHLALIASAATSTHNELATLLRGSGGVKRLTD